MYNLLFDEKRQNEMRSFFLELSKKGTLKKYLKNKTIEIPGTDFVAIVVEGKVKQSLYSSRGLEKLLYILQSGEIFGEMDYFSGGKCTTIVKTMEKSVVSIVQRTVIEEKLAQNPEVYRYFIHSMIRKFRIVMMQMADMAFNDALGRIADILLRLASQQGVIDGENIVIDLELTHQDLANLIGCSRITVTRGLNEFRDKNLVDIQNRRILIKDPERLSDYIDAVF